MLVLFDFAVSLGNPDVLSTYNTCIKEFSCGNITGVSYPFWGDDRPLGCGLYDLQLHCQDEGDGIAAATIEIKGVQYSVLSLNKDAQTIRLARQDYLKGLCSPLLANTTLDSKLFDYAPGDYQYITFVYGCPSPLEEALIPFQISCSEAGNPLTGIGYFLLGSQPQGPGKCNVSVSVPVLSDLQKLLGEGTSLFPNLVQIIEGAIGEGFEVRLKVNSKACWECLDSKGACGYDLVLNQTTCYCKDQSQPSSRTCSASPTDEGPSSPPSPTGEGPSSPESFLQSTYLSIMFLCNVLLIGISC